MPQIRFARPVCLKWGMGPRQADRVYSRRESTAGKRGRAVTQAPFDLDRARRCVDAVLDICRRRGQVLILMQNNPDPDAIASAAALKRLVRETGTKRVVIGYGGIVGRAENQAMLRVLDIETQHVRPQQAAASKTVCLVDTQPLRTNNVLWRDRAPEIVIDHHLAPGKRRGWSAEFVDVRPDYGATSTILYEYLLAADIKPSQDLATALFYGIRSDTQDLGREAGPADIAAFQQLAPLADLRKLARIRRAPVSAKHFKTLADSLRNAVITGRTVICPVPDQTTPDMIAEVADMLLRLERARMTVCYGDCGGLIYVSVRAVDSRSNAARCVQRLLKGLGSGGGHRTMAAGQIPVTGDSEPLLEKLGQRIIEEYGGGQALEPLAPPGPAPPPTSPRSSS